MMKMIFIRMCSGIISAFLISLTLAWWNTTPETEQIVGTYYTTFSGNFWIPFLAMSFIYVIAAVPFSLFIVDGVMYRSRKEGNRLLNFVLQVLLYLCGGIVAYILFVTLLARTIDVRFFNFYALLFSGSAGVAYMLVVKILEYFFVRRTRSIEKGEES